MTERTREEQLRQIPLWRPDVQSWPPGVREVGREELDCLGIDRLGNLYWQGMPVEVRRFSLSNWQTVGAILVTISAVVAAIGAAVQGWTAYHDWACDVGWWTLAACAP